MATHLIRCRYTPEGFKGMISSPSDRGAAIQKLFTAMEMRVDSIHFSTSTCELYIMCETGEDPIKLVAAELIVLGTGAIAEVQVINLIDSKTLLDAMKLGGTISGAYKPPSTT